MPSSRKPSGRASHRAIAALAILKVNWDGQRDYIANFVPLVAHCIRQAGADAVSVPEVQAQVLETFGLRIPQGALKTILNRAARDGLVRREHNAYWPDKTALAAVNLDPARDSVLRQYEQLVQRLREFASQHGRNWSEDQADRALLSYVEELAAPILGVAIEGGPVMDLPRTAVEGSAILGQFVLALCRSEPQGFAYLETIVKGSMLANVLYFPEAFSGGRPKLRGIDIYLDTPVALRVLGYSEGHYCAPALEMVELLRAQGASLKMFDHTLTEVDGVLFSAAENYRRGRPGEILGDVVDFFASEEMTSSDVQAVIATLSERLTEQAIAVVKTPPQTEPLAVHERDLEDLLNREVGYRRREALLKDLDSLTAIHRLRDGQLRRRIEHSDAVLVTSNSALCKASQTFFTSVHGAAGVPLCVLDSRLASLAWLMNPVQAADLPRKQIIATSYAALNPTESVWARYLAEIRRLAANGDISDEQVVLLVFSPEARLELANVTDGDPDAFTEGTVLQILQHARGAAQAEVRAELDNERERREEAERRMSSEMARAAEAVRSAAAVAHAHANRISEVARVFARTAGWALFVVAFAVVVAGTGFATAGLFPDKWSKAIPFLASFFVVAAVAAGVASLAWGLSLRSIVDGTERLLHQRIERRLARLFTPSVDDDPQAGESNTDR